MNGLVWFRNDLRTTEIRIKNSPKIQNLKIYKSKRYERISVV